MSELFDTPEWLDGNEHIIEPIFCDWFLYHYPMRCIHDHFYTVDGLVADESSIMRDIYCAIEEYVDTGIAKKVKQLYEALKITAYLEPPPLQTDRIHVANGTYHMDGTFSEDKEFCMNRLTVRYVPDAPPPTRWLQFLSELLYEEDIPTMQEYLGYCLLPTTKGQKMLMLIGKGGEGKSRIGLVMNAIFGTSMNTTSIQKVETNRFARADLESKLLMVDDDMDMNALPKTNHIKSIVTSECKMDVERKEDVKIISDYRDWILKPERKAPKEKREYAAKILDSVMNKIRAAAQSLVTQVMQTLMKPETRAAGVEAVKGKARESVLDRLAKSKVKADQENQARWERQGRPQRTARKNDMEH